jgi:hypothetical protein
MIHFFILSIIQFLKLCFNYNNNCTKVRDQNSKYLSSNLSINKYKSFSPLKSRKVDFYCTSSRLACRLHRIFLTDNYIMYHSCSSYLTFVHEHKYDCHHVLQKRISLCYVHVQKLPNLLFHTSHQNPQL